MYKTALEKSLKRKVDKTYIYSTELNKEVKIYQNLKAKIKRKNKKINLSV